MPQGCVVPNCTSRYGTAEKVSMYRFPLAKPKLVARWLKAIKKPNWEPTKNSRICCRHFEEDCFWSYNGRNALTPYAIPTKFNAIPRDPESIYHVNGQHFQNVSKPWCMPPARTKDVEPALVTQDIVYIKTEPDLYLCENEYTIKEEPQSDMETEINSFDVGQIKIEDDVGNGEQGPMPIVFPVVKDEIKEEPEDTTYSLPPSVFARLGSPPVFEERTLNLNLRKVKKPTHNEHPTTLCSPKKQSVRKRRRRIREEGLLSDHTYVKFKLGSKVKAGSVGKSLNHEKVCTTALKYSHVSVQCEEKMFLQSDIRMKTKGNVNANNCMLGLELEVGKHGHINNMSKKFGTGINSKKANTRTNPTNNTRRISKFPSVTFSNSKCKNGLVLNSKQRKYSVCKKLLETFKNDLELKSDKQEVSSVEDFNKENTVCLDKCYNAVISRDLDEDSLHGLDIGQVTEVQNECLNIGGVKKNSSNVFFGVVSTRDKLNKLGTSIELEHKYELDNKYTPKMDKKFSESLSLISSNGDQTHIAPTSVKQNNANNLTRRHHRSRKKKKLWSLGKQKSLIRSVKVKQTLQNNKITGYVTNKVANVGDNTSDCETKLYSLGHINTEENFVKEEVAERHLCVLCDELFPCQESLRIHVARHCQESAYACLYCVKTFGDDECLRSHIETHVLHKCVLCCAELPSKSALCEHVLAHFGGAVIKCEHCPKTFYGTKLYEEHQLLHAVASEYVCKICKKVVTTEIEYFEHMKSHVKRLSFLNSQNQTFALPETAPMQNGIASMQVYNKTIKVEDESESLDEKNIERRLVCAICNELCVNETDYKEHVLRHKKTKIPVSASRKQCVVVCRNPVTCMLCGRKFASEILLKKHILVHTGEIQQSCGTVQDLDR